MTKHESLLNSKKTLGKKDGTTRSSLLQRTAIHHTTIKRGVGARFRQGAGRESPFYQQNFTQLPLNGRGVSYLNNPYDGRKRHELLKAQKLACNGKQETKGAEGRLETEGPVYQAALRGKGTGNGGLSEDEKMKKRLARFPGQVDAIKKRERDAHNTRTLLVGAAHQELSTNGFILTTGAWKHIDTHMVDAASLTAEIALVSQGQPTDAEQRSKAGEIAVTWKLPKRSLDLLVRKDQNATKQTLVILVNPGTGVNKAIHFGPIT